jgi:long-chain fatty acid transport protein
MRKLLTVLCVTGLALSFTTTLMAGGITNKQNFSAEYLRTFSRNAATDSADAIAFNPAGVMMMGDGIYVNGALFYAAKDYSNTIGGTEQASDEPSVVPGLFGLYKTDKWALFGAFTIPAGGGKVEYAGGNATSYGYGMLLMQGVNFQLTLPPALGGMSLPAANYYDTISNQNVQAESIYYGYTVGGSYKINDTFSIALGARYIDANKEAQASITISPGAMFAALMPAQTFNIDYEETADGLGGFIGLSITPRGPYNIGIRYETKTGLDFKTAVSRDDTGMLVNGAEKSEDLPGLFGIGVAYKLSPNLILDTSFTYYLEEDANREDARFQNVGNGYDFAISLEYGFNDRLKGSFGWMITKTDISPDNMVPEAPELDAATLCGGIAYAFNPNLELNLALMNTFYDAELTSTGIKLDKNILGFGCGIQYKFK